MPDDPNEVLLGRLYQNGYVDLKDCDAVARWLDALRRVRDLADDIMGFPGPAIVALCDDALRQVGEAPVTLVEGASESNNLEVSHG
jgi:hypothetical protein